MKNRTSSMASWARASGPESVRGRAEVRLEDRLEHELGRRLHDPVAHRRDAQASELPRALRDQPLTRGQRTIGAILELLAELGEDTINAHLLDVLAGLAIDTGGPRPPVAFHPLPRDEQRRGVADQVEQIAETLLLVLGCPSVQLRLPSQYPLLRRPSRQAARAYSRPTSRTASDAAVLLSAFAMWTAFPSSDYYADSATPRAHQPASGLAGLPPAARRARGASHVHHDPFDRVGSWLCPYSAIRRALAVSRRPPRPGK